jgi:hypothetical protein
MAFHEAPERRQRLIRVERTRLPRAGSGGAAAAGQRCGVRSLIGQRFPSSVPSGCHDPGPSGLALEEVVKTCNGAASDQTTEPPRGEPNSGMSTNGRLSEVPKYLIPCLLLECTWATFCTPQELHFFFAGAMLIL